MEHETPSVALATPSSSRLRTVERRSLMGASEVAARRDDDLFGDGFNCVEGPSGRGELEPRGGVSAIVATHDPEVATHASRVTSLKDGLVVQDTAR
jgi:hypothetical protein